MKKKSTDLFSLLETKIRQPNHDSFAKLFEDWDFYTSRESDIPKAPKTIWVL